MPRTSLASLLLTLGLALPSLAAAPAPAGPAPPAAASAPVDEASDQLEAALKALKKVAGKDDLEQRREALAVVVALGSEDALEPLLQRYARARGAAAAAERELEEAQILLERRRVQLAELELAAERKTGLEPQVQALSQEIRDLEDGLARQGARLELERPWSDDLRDGAAQVLAAQGDSKQRALLKELWKVTEKGSNGDDRVAAAELLARVGIPSTATRIAKAMQKELDEAIKLQKGLPPLEAKVNEWGRKFQEEATRLGGQITNSTAAAYERARVEASSLRKRVTDTGRLATELRAAAALALDLQAPETRAEEIGDLLKLGRRSVHGLEYLELLEQAAVPEAAAALAELLAEGEGVLDRARSVDALARLGAAGIDSGRDLEAWLLTEGLAAESWHLRSRVVAALATLRSAAAVPILIGRLDAETGRLRGDIGAALVSLTGQDFHGNVTLWQRWWGDHGDGFVVSDTPPPSSEERALAEVGLTFFGLSTESQRVLFVLDVSGSMELPMTTYSSAGGNDTTGEQRITVAKRELLKALGGIKDGGTFNIVLYASDVWTWADGPVEMDADSRAEATAFVETIKPVGGTNIYGAMQHGLREARGAKKKKGAPRWVEPAYDTIFLLSDGVPSMGISTERDGILTMVSEENADLGAVIHTIGLSSDQDAVLMRSLAERNGGTYAAR